MPLPDPVPPRAPLDEGLIRRRQRSRAIATAIVLFGLVVLFYGISIAKMVH